MKKLEASVINRPHSISWYPLVSSVLDFVSERRRAPRGEGKKTSKGGARKAKEGQEKKAKKESIKEKMDRVASTRKLVGNRLHV